VKILFLGDVVGEPGRRAVREAVPHWRDQNRLDLVVVNGENAAGGSGITEKTAAELFGAGVDVITTGDHVWDQKEAMSFISKESRLLRPLNYPDGTIGHATAIVRVNSGSLIAVVSLQGRTFMPDLDNPFLAIRTEVSRLRAQTPLILIDFHAEATSEKIALGRMLDGQVTAVIGTHTHVQTADDQVFPGGTAFLCDAGFTGPHESVLGREIEPVLQRFLTGLPQRFTVASERVLIQGALIEADASTGRALSIQRVSQAVR
jgi:2',3'-cyclic-nucleotide 2'-phosphodiesterase